MLFNRKDTKKKRKGRKALFLALRPLRLINSFLSYYVYNIARGFNYGNTNCDYGCVHSLRSSWLKPRAMLNILNII